VKNQLADADRWSRYFDSLTADTNRVIATVQPLGQEVSEVNGAQSLLRGITYDVEEDVLEVDLGGPDGGRPALRYFVFSPRAILVAQSHGATLVLVRDGARELTLIRLVRAPRSWLAPACPPEETSPPQGDAPPAAPQARIHRAS
jgi:hypothetical protein